MSNIKNRVDEIFISILIVLNMHENKTETFILFWYIDQPVFRLICLIENSCLT